MSCFLRVRSCALLCLLIVGTASAAPDATTSIFVGPADSAGASLARDLASQVGAATGQRITVSATDGLLDTLGRLRDGEGLRLGIVNEDAVSAFGAAADRGFGEAANLVAPLRAIATLHKLSFHFVVRADAPYQGLESMRGARINLGPIDGNTAVSVMNYYQKLFGEPIANDKASFLSHEEALVRLVTDRTIDVVAIVGEQPVRVLADMRADARRFVRLVGAAPANADPLLSRSYPAERLQARHYGNLLDRDVATVSVRAVLAAWEERRGEHELALAMFARGLCERFPRLQREGHAGWRDVTLVQPEPAMGWYYASPLVRGEIRRCSTGAPVNIPVPACTAVERAMKVCD
jgi:hypothetical protein